MARNRQRAKQRQADRRARRLAEQGGDGQDVSEAPGLDPNLAVGAPPQDEGHSDQVVRDQPDHDEPETDEPFPEEAEEAYEDVEPIEDEAEEAYAPTGRRGDAAAAAASDRPRFVQFLIACWAELQRVQWPNRQALTTLTGVVLGFVLIAGGYLGLLDAIFSRLVNSIL